MKQHVIWNMWSLLENIRLMFVKNLLDYSSQQIIACLYSWQFKEKQWKKEMFINNNMKSDGYFSNSEVSHLVIVFILTSLVFS